MTASHAINQMIGERLDARESGRNGVLVEETMGTCEQYLVNASREEMEEYKAKTYHRIVIQENLREAVR